MENFIIYMRGNFFPNESFELYVIGIIQGLLYGMCAIPCETTLWDCERFNDFIAFPVDCTDEHCKKFMGIIEQKYPGLCHYKKIERS